MAHITWSGRSAGEIRFFFPLVFLILPLSSLAQQPNCTFSSTTPTVHAEGLAEQIGDITLSCSGGGNGTVNTFLFVGLNANITNRLDANNNLTGITATGTGVTASQPTLYSPTALFFSGISWNTALSPNIVISGIRVAVPTATGGPNPAINATIQANNLNFPINQPLIPALSAPTLLSSVLNYGIPCLGSPTPTTINFPNLISTGTAVSTIRITEASLAAFTPKTGNADFGVRFLVTLAGYGSNTQVYVPDMIVGYRGTTPTTSGAFNTTTNGGTYTPGTGQLLLTRVNGADGNGLGGSLFAASPPGSPTSFTSVTQIPLVNGSATVTYEVLDANNFFIDEAQIPVFVTAPATSCNTLVANNLTVGLAPISTVATPTQTDPIPRYIATPAASDCTADGDCAAAYFPVLQAAPATISVSSSSLGQPQTGFITVSDGGNSQFSFTVTTTYQTPSGLSTGNWLSVNGTTGTTLTGVVDPVAGVTSLGLSLSASPAALMVAGTYQATVTINAGSAGSMAIPVTFTVSPAGPVIQSVVNSANGQPGPVTPGSYATIYGLNLAPKTTTPATVSFSGLPATVVYDGSTQINVLVPSGLANAFTSTVAATATVDGVASNNFPVTLATNAPAVFTPGILNQNNSINLATAPASRSDIIQIFLTGLATPVNVPVTVMIGTQALTGSQIIYSGPTTYPGLEQINVQVPAALTFTGNSAPLSVCVPGSGTQPVCSAPVSLYLH